jgi:hypothetical protein
MLTVGFSVIVFTCSSRRVSSPTSLENFVVWAIGLKKAALLFLGVKIVDLI